MVIITYVMRNVFSAFAFANAGLIHSQEIVRLNSSDIQKHVCRSIPVNPGIGKISLNLQEKYFL